MALKVYQSYDIYEKDFDELFCRECARNGSSVDTLNFCVGCESLFCFQCLQDHKRDNDDTKGIPTEQDRKISNNNNKPSSSKLETNNNISYNKNTSKNQNQVKHQLKQTLLSLQNQLLDHINHDKTENEHRLKKIQEHAERKMGELRTRIMAWLDEIQLRLSDSVLHLHQEIEKVYDAEKLPVHILIAKTEATLNKVQTLDTTDVDELVNFTEQTKSEAIKLFEDPDNYYKNILTNLEKVQLDNINDLLTESVDELLCNINVLAKSFITGDYNNQSEVRSYDVQGPKDITVCDINGSCIMPDRSVILTDWNNTNIKLLNPTYQVTDTCDLPGIPWAVCCTGNKEVAVSLHLHQKIQFVSITENRLQLSHCFKVREKCRGVSYADNKIYVGCGGGGILEGIGQVHVYDRMGVLLQVFKLDMQSNRLLSCPQHICINEDNSVLYIADKNIGIVRINLLNSSAGETNIQAIDGSKSEEAKGICMTDDSTILMCDFILNNLNIYNIDQGKIKRVQNLQDKNHITCNPQSLCFNKLNNHLVVTSGNTNYIQVFKTAILK